MVLLLYEWLRADQAKVQKKLLFSKKGKLKLESKSYVDGHLYNY